MNRRAHDVTQAMRSLERAYLIGVDGVTEIWLVRHADVYDRLEEPDDPPLSDRGREQAKRLGQRLQRLSIGAVYSSPHRRAVETARAVSDHPRIDPRLAEARADYAGGRLNVQEPAEAVISRMQAAIDDAAGGHSGQRVVMVGHGIAILNYLGHLLRLEPGTLRLFPPYASISVIRAKDGRRVAGTLFDVGHLEGMP